MWDFGYERVPSLLKQLQNASPDVLGAEEHGFELNELLTDDEVLRFEEAHSIVLPQDYRVFLTQLGNGGAGPHYGMFRLGEVDDGFGYRKWHEDDGLVGVLSQPFPLSEAWNDLSAMPDIEQADRDEAEYERRNSDFEKAYWSTGLVNGAIPICHEGCAIRIWLVVNGERAGSLWEDKRSEFGGLNPMLRADGMPVAFSSWYGEWLDAFFGATPMN